MRYSARVSKESLIRTEWGGCQTGKSISQRSCWLRNKISSRICNSLYWFIQKIATIGEDVAHAPASLSRARPLLLLLSLRPKREMRFMIVAGTTTSISPASHPASPSSFSPPYFLSLVASSYRTSDIISKVKLPSDSFSMLPPSFPPRS